MNQSETKKARVVRVIARLNVGGPARHVVWLTVELPRAGYESFLVAGTVPPGEDDMSYFAAQHGVQPIVIPEMSREISPKDAVTIWKLYRLLVSLRPQIVHTHTAKAGTVGRVAGLLYRWLTPAALIGRPRRCSFVHTYHGHIFHSYYSKFKTSLFLAVEKILARMATDRIIVISEQQRREIHEEFGVGRKPQLKVIPLGLDLTPFASWAERRETLRNELGIRQQELLIGIVGRLTEIKNHQMFLEAAALLKDDFSHVRFVIIGDGHLRPALEQLAAQLGLTTQIIFLGLRNDPENFYPALDIVALTSLNEGTPLTLIEAMANARAVAATAVGGVIDLLGEAKAIPDAPSDVMLGERGVLVRGHDPVDFGQALSILIKDEALRRELGERGRQFVQDNYSKERLVNDIVNLYDNLLSLQTISRMQLEADQSS